MLTKRDFLCSVPLAAITTVVTKQKSAQAQSATSTGIPRRGPTNALRIQRFGPFSPEDTLEQRPRDVPRPV